MKLENGNLKLAVQKKGRLTEKSLAMLKDCGFDIENYNERLLVTVKNFSLDIIFLRDDDIPEYVQDGVADIGIVGNNVVQEKGAKIEICRYLGFGKCNLLIAVPESAELNSVQELKGKKIATSYPVILKKYLNENNIEANIIEISGSVEIAPSLGVADYICDIVSTGNTLKSNKLKKSFPVFESQAVLISNNNLRNDEIKFDLLKSLLKRIDSVLSAEKSNYLMLNTSQSSLNEVLKIIPALKSPTIMPLADGEMVAIHAVISSDKFWSIEDKLKIAGASGLLLLPINNMIV